MKKNMTIYILIIVVLLFTAGYYYLNKGIKDLDPEGKMTDAEYQESLEEDFVE